MLVLSIRSYGVVVLQKERSWSGTSVTAELWSLPVRKNSIPVFLLRILTAVVEHVHKSPKNSNITRGDRFAAVDLEVNL